MNLKKLTLLHSNDMHGDFLAEELDAELVGGVSMLSGYINKTRKEEKNVIYAIAGDMFRGSVIDSEYKGLSTIELMNLLGPDIVTLGNHEVDYGIGHLLFIEKCAKFPIINANLYIKTNHARLFKPHHIIHIDGMNILFIGILTEEVMASAKKEGVIGTFIDIGEAANEIGRICNTYKSVDIDFTVVLTHIGFEEDKKLAALLDEEWGVDLIIGGHSHTLLDAPCEVNGIPIVQAGSGTNQLGRFDLVIDTDKNAIDSYTWQLIPINEDNCPRDQALEDLIASYKTETDQKYGRIVTRFSKELTHPNRYMETSLGDLLSDILQESLGVDLMLLGSGSIRTEKMGPIVLYQDLVETFPYYGSITMIKVNGAQLTRMIRYFLRDEAFIGEHTEFYQVSNGMRIVYSFKDKVFRELTLGGEAVSDARTYTVALQDFHFKNLKEFFDVSLEEVAQLQKPRVVATSCLDILDEYLSSANHPDKDVEGRIVILDR
jgi:5'-nucleotidase